MTDRTARRAEDTYDPRPLLARYPGYSDAQLAVVLGVNTHTIVRWRDGHHRIHFVHADRLAIRRLGVHPAEIWADWGTETWLLNRLGEIA